MNPYKIVINIVKGIGYTLFGLLIAAFVALVFVTGWQAFGVWALLYVPAIVVAIVAALFVLAAISVGLEELGLWFERKAHQRERELKK